MDYQRLKDLIDLSAQYEQEGHKGTLHEFLAWALATQETAYKDLMGAQEKGMHNLDSVIGMLVTFTYRYAKGYIKKGLAEAGDEISGDEFGYMAGMQFRPQGISKMELIAENVHEKTTGMEIIGRLLRKGFLKQANNPADGRSKLLFLTEAGKAALGKAYGPLYMASQIIGGNLTLAEKKQLFSILEKLHGFHKPIYLNEKESKLGEIGTKYLG